MIERSRPLGIGGALEADAEFVNDFIELTRARVWRNVGVVRRHFDLRHHWRHVGHRAEGGAAWDKTMRSSFEHNDANRHLTGMMQVRDSAVSFYDSQYFAWCS